MREERAYSRESIVWNLYIILDFQLKNFFIYYLYTQGIELYNPIFTTPRTLQTKNVCFDAGSNDNLYKLFQTQRRKPL